jgi:type IV fimbrial biogenesis protein FimT
MLRVVNSVTFTPREISSRGINRVDPRTANATERRPRNACGVSLIELLITVSIAAIILTLATPNFLNLIRDYERTSHVNAMLMGMQLARSESIKSGRDVVVCSRASQGTCGGKNDWSKGWIVFENADQDDPPVVDTGEAIIRETEHAAGLKWQSSLTRFVYRPFNRRSTNGSLIYCDSRGGDATRAVVVSWTGRPRVAPYQSDGTAYACS